MFKLDYPYSHNQYWRSDMMNPRTEGTPLGMRPAQKPLGAGSWAIDPEQFKSAQAQYGSPAPSDLKMPEIGAAMAQKETAAPTLMGGEAAGAGGGLSAMQAGGIGLGAGFLKDMLIDAPRRRQEAMTNARMVRYGGQPMFAPNTSSAWNSGLQGMMTGIGLQQRDQERRAREEERSLDNELRRSLLQQYAQQVMMGKKGTI